MDSFVQFAHVRDVTVVRLTCKVGTIQQINFDQVEQKILSAAEQSGSWKVLLDMDRVDYFHSLGISFLVRLQQVLRSHRGALRICNLQPQALEILTLTRVSDILTIKSTEAVALEGFASASPPDSTPAAAH